MKEFLGKIKGRLKVFDNKHNGILSKNKISIGIMGLAMAIVIVTATVMMITNISQENSGDKETKTPALHNTKQPDEETMVKVDDVTTIPPISESPVTSKPPATTPPIPEMTLIPVPSSTPDPIVDTIEKPEDVVVNDTVMKEEDKKDDGKNNSNKGNNSNNTSLIQKEDNSKYIENANNKTYTDNGFYMKEGFKYYAKDGKTISKVGIDVSIYQKDIDWKKVKASGVDFVMIRLGFRGYVTGKLMLDANFKKNIDGALDAGLDVGIYFFSQAVTTKEAVEEASMCIKYLKPYKGKITYPVAIDTEYVDSTSARTNKSTVTNKVRTDVCIAFCETIKSAGYKPMIYANKHWLLNNLQLSRLNNYDIWYAKYGGTTPAYDYDFTIWQYTGSGRVDGIVGDVDLNVGLKDYSAGGKGDKPEKTPKPDTSEKPKEDLSSENEENPDGTQTPGNDETQENTSKEPQSTQIPEENENPQETKGPDEGENPDGTKTPEGGNEPEDTRAPEQSNKPIESKKPDNTKAPAGTQQPETTKEPEASKEPEESQQPEATKEPEASKEPEESQQPEVTKEPEASKEPEESQQPETTKEPETSKEPEESQQPEATKEPEASKEPEEPQNPETTKEPETSTEPEKPQQ